jgi:Flp pilus assembly CpaE family ATPase
MARAFGVPYLGSIPMDPNVLAACEAGTSFLDAYPGSAAAAAFSGIVDKIVIAASSSSSASSSAGPAMDTSS